MKINTSQKVINKQTNINQLNLGLNIIALALIGMIKISSLIFKSNLEFNIFDILTIVLSILGIVLSIIYLRVKGGLLQDTITSSLATASLVLCGLALFMYNEPIQLHKIIYFGVTIILFLGMFIAFLVNKVGLKKDKSEVPNIKLNFIMIIVGIVVTLAIIITTNYISKKYYNDTLTIFIGTFAMVIGCVYSTVVAVNIKKMRIGQN